MFSFVNCQGGADKSYGIQVAKLAGVPDTVIERAKELVEELTNADITEKIQEIPWRTAKSPGQENMIRLTWIRCLCWIRLRTKMC